MSIEARFVAVVIACLAQSIDATSFRLRQRSVHDVATTSNNPASSLKRRAHYKKQAAVTHPHGPTHPASDGTHLDTSETHPGGPEDLGLKDAPSVFVATLVGNDTSREQRDSLRYMWRHVGKGTGFVCSRFAICGDIRQVKTDIRLEQSLHNDFLFLDCTEGYSNGRLTEKVLAVMRAYDQDKNLTGCEGRDLLMKMDADTFVSGRRFRAGLRSVAKTDVPFLYAGVTASGFDPVIRDPSSKFYEPTYTYVSDTYPMTMLGGPGYVLGRGLVNMFLRLGIAKSNMLWNEDRAVAVWVDLAKARNPVVEMEIPGADGLQEGFVVHKGPWKDYPYVLHHHIRPATIDCLSDLEVANDPDAPIDHCMSMTPELI